MATKVEPQIETFARIKVIGVGGSGKNATNHMIESKVRGGIEFIAINTDAQDLHNSQSKHKIHIGKNLTRGLGTGMNPDLGRAAAEETKEEIQNAIKGADMVFVTCGTGGGTGSGAAPIVAQLAKDLGILTIAVVTRPFWFEGKTRSIISAAALANLKKSVDALIVIPNDRIMELSDKDTTVFGENSGFIWSDEILKQAVEGISDLITTPGFMNVDFADVRKILENAGTTLMGIGSASGDKRAEEAANAAIKSPLLEVTVNGAKGVLFSIAGGDDLKMLEIQSVAKVITENIDKDANVIFGTIHDDRLKKGEIKVTVIASGFPENNSGDMSAWGEVESLLNSSSDATSRLSTPEQVEVKKPEPVKPPTTTERPWFRSAVVESGDLEEEKEEEVIEEKPKEINYPPITPNVKKGNSKVITIDESEGDDEEEGDNLSGGWVPTFMRHK